jgi:hypothetical protein
MNGQLWQKGSCGSGKVERNLFISEYPVHDGMSVTTIRIKREIAMQNCLTELDKWLEKSKSQIINIQEKSFTSNDIRDSPFWEALVVFSRSTEERLIETGGES